MESNAYIYYLNDTLHILFERGKEAREDYLLKKTSSDTSATQFAQGILIGYYECLNTLINQAKSFDLPLEQLYENIEPDELLKPNAGDVQ